MIRPARISYPESLTRTGQLRCHDFLVWGKLTQIGSYARNSFRIRASGGRRADRGFKSLTDESTGHSPATDDPPPGPPGLPPWLWVGGLVLLVLATIPMLLR